MNLTLSKEIPTIDDADAIIDLRQRRFGWLSPAGQLLVCALHSHFDILVVHGVLAKSETDRLAAAIKLISAKKKACSQRQGGRIHQEWHTVEMARDDADCIRRQILEGIYAKGWIRLGIHETNPALHAEGLGKPLRSRRRTIEDLAALAHLEPKLEPYDAKAHLTSFDYAIPTIIDTTW